VERFVSFAVLAKRKEGAGHQAPRRRVLRRQLEPAEKGGDGVAGLAKRRQHPSQHKLRFSERRLERDGAAQHIARGEIVAGPIQRLAVIGEQRSAFALLVEDLSEQSNGFAIVARLPPGDGGSQGLVWENRRSRLGHTRGRLRAARIQEQVRRGYRKFDS